MTHTPSHSLQKHGHPHGQGAGGLSTLRLVAWETTRNCNLSCVHCRAAATQGPYAGELDTESSLRLLDQIAEVGQAIVILTGGEPLLRPDIFELAAYGTQKGLRMVMAPNGPLINADSAIFLAETASIRVPLGAMTMRSPFWVP